MSEEKLKNFKDLTRKQRICIIFKEKEEELSDCRRCNGKGHVSTHGMDSCSRICLKCDGSGKDRPDFYQKLHLGMTVEETHEADEYREYINKDYETFFKEHIEEMIVKDV